MTPWGNDAHGESREKGMGLRESQGSTSVDMAPKGLTVKERGQGRAGAETIPQSLQ